MKDDRLPVFANLLHEPARRPEEIVLERGATAHDLLRIIYSCPDLPLTMRMRAAMAALPFESPKLAMVAQVNEQGFAELLDRRLKKMEEARLIEHQSPAVEVKAPPPRIPDRRYRRIYDKERGPVSSSQLAQGMTIRVSWKSGQPATGGTRCSLEGGSLRAVAPDEPSPTTSALQPLTAL